MYVSEGVEKLFSGPAGPREMARWRALCSGEVPQKKPVVREEIISVIAGGQVFYVPVEEIGRDYAKLTPVGGIRMGTEAEIRERAQYNVLPGLN
ncbi:MAG: hypothetical protein HY366_00785 [Candidatus Aenigmarchaeota archaeon]|nr:hypothetical protein [Candidatus Aenigmarchaeota archaeon]